MNAPILRALPSYPDLKGKVALVTGGSRGIGAATCYLLAANGATVVVNGRDDAAIRAVVEVIRAGAAERSASPLTEPPSQPSSACANRWDTNAVPSTCWLLVGGQGEYTPTAQITEDRWRLVFDANLTATFPKIFPPLPRESAAEPRCSTMFRLVVNGQDVPL